MKIVQVCKVCDGFGRLETSIPFLKKTCPSCNGTGKQSQTLSEYREL